MIRVAHSDVVKNVGITSINSAKNFHIFSNGPYIFLRGLLEIPDYIILIIIHKHNGKVLGYPHFSAPS